MKPLIACSVFVLVLGCQTAQDPEYLASIEEWRTERLASLQADDGYLVLAGLYWLKPGENSYGSAESNDVIFPIGPDRIGTFVMEGDSVFTIIDEGVEVVTGGVRVEKTGLYPTDEARKILEWGPLKWYVIRRGDELGIRLRNLESKVRSEFAVVDHFPVDQQWELEARFTPYNPTKQIPILNIVGYTIDTPSDGFLTFVIMGQEVMLDVLPGGDDTYFIIFGDATNRESTYGAGRYMYISKADTEGKTIIDFNKAFNPPCAFTEFATCPLPPPQNRLTISINAGEKLDYNSYQKDILL